MARAWMASHVVQVPANIIETIPVRHWRIPIVGKMFKQIVFLAIVAVCLARPPPHSRFWELYWNNHFGNVRNSTTFPHFHGCGNSPNLKVAPHIVGGHEAQPHSHPWMAELRYNGRQICGGAFVGSKYVLTAAHCTVRGYLSSFEVCLGKHDITDRNETGQQCFRVVRKTEHERYSGRTLENDIALLELSSAPVQSETVSPLCLSSEPPSTHEHCVVTGWGATHTSVEASHRLRQVNVPIVNHALCNSWYSGRVLPTMVCAGYELGRKDSCQGDSGGPLICRRGGRFESVGIVSWGYGCAEHQRPGVYTSTYDFVRWLAGKTI